MVTGSRSARTSSSKLPPTFEPGLGFQYRFNANRTFSRGSRRPVSSPARIKQSSALRNYDKYVAPEDIIAMAQSPSPTLFRESLGDSLIMLQSRYESVNPAKFTNLGKIMHQKPSTCPPGSPRNDMSTPRLVRQISQMINSGITNRSVVNTGMQTSEVVESAHRTAWGKRSLDVVLPRTSDSLLEEKPMSRLSSREKSSLISTAGSFEERCNRCADIPDIQIEGRSLTRMLPNNNTVMAREHCEILGTESCPDCLKTRTRKKHERHCASTTPSPATDVYKIALVHEKAPNLTKRQVQRKLLEGDISDNILTPLSHWQAPESHVLTCSNIQKQQVETDSVDNDLKNETPALKLSRSKSRRILNSFETIPEISENGIAKDDKKEGHSEDNPKEQINCKDNTPNTVKYQMHESAILQQINVVSPMDTSHLKRSTDIPLKPGQKTSSRAKKAKRNKQVETLNIDLNTILNQKHVRNDSTKRSVGYDSRLLHRPSDKAELKLFTRNTVPSPNFFFDIADLSEKLRQAEVCERSKRLRQQERERLALAVRQCASPHNLSIADDAKAETASTESFDSVNRVTEFNMAYEPPVMFENKGRYLGARAPKAGTIASTVKV